MRKEIEVKAKVKNAGPASSQAKVKVTVKKLRKFGEAFSSPKIIPSGQSKKLPLVRVEWKGIPQKYIAEICAMPVGSAIDTNTANDCVSQEITVPPAPAPRAKVSAFTKNLSIGSMGLEVTKVQQCLASELYLEETPTGTYGPQTEAAVKEFQTDEGIQATGVWNADTMKAANDIPCFEEDTSQPTPSPTPSPTTTPPPTNEPSVVTPPQTNPEPTPTPTPSASSGQPTPPPPQQIALSITEARFTGTASLKINGAAKEFTFTLANNSNQILTGISYKVWIEQNGIKSKEVSKQITCGPGPGKVPATGCKEYGTISATSPLTTSGQAQAIFQIISAPISDSV